MRAGVYLAMIAVLLLAPGAASGAQAEDVTGEDVTLEEVTGEEAAAGSEAAGRDERLSMVSVMTSHGFRRRHTAGGIHTRLFTYYRAGSRLWYVDERQEDLPPSAGIPERLAAEARSGPVWARVYAHPQPSGPAEELAGWLARGAEAAMELVWPGEADPVHFRVRLVSLGEPVERVHSRARLPRGAWRLTYYHLDMLGDDRSRYSVAYINLHELFHFMSLRRGIGVKAAHAASRPRQARFVEEVAANLFATCGLLVATGEAHLALHAGWTAQADGRDFSYPLSAGDLHYLLDVVQAGRTHGGGGVEGDMGPMIYDSLLALISDGAQTVRHGTPQAELLLQACRRVCADPFELDPLLREMTADGRGVPVFEPLEAEWAAPPAAEDEAA